MIIVQITDTHIEEPGSLAYERFDTAANLRAAVAAVRRVDAGHGVSYGYQHRTQRESTSDSGV